MSIRLLITLMLIAVGFFFGKYLGALSLPLLFYVATQKKNRQNTRKNEQRKSRDFLHKGKSSDKSNDWAYELLNVSRNENIATIKQARNRQINRYHPDKMPQASIQEKRLAEKHLNQINRAFTAILHDKEP